MYTTSTKFKDSNLLCFNTGKWDCRELSIALDIIYILSNLIAPIDIFFLQRMLTEEHNKNISMRAHRGFFMNAHISFRFAGGGGGGLKGRVVYSINRFFFILNNNCNINSIIKNRN